MRSNEHNCDERRQGGPIMKFQNVKTNPWLLNTSELKTASHPFARAIMRHVPAQRNSASGLRKEIRVKCVFTARDGFEASFVRGLLEQVGIRTDVRDENLGEVFPWVASMLPKVFVSEEELARAEEIVVEYRAKLLKNGGKGRETGRGRRRRALALPVRRGTRDRVFFLLALRT
jgi:hypothetical protein